MIYLVINQLAVWEKERKRKKNPWYFPVGMRVAAHWDRCLRLGSPSGKGRCSGDRNFTHKWCLILSMSELKDRRVPLTGRSCPLPTEGEQCPCPAPLPPPSPTSCLPITSSTASSRLPPWDVGHFSHCTAWPTAMPTHWAGRGQFRREEDIP